VHEAFLEGTDFSEPLVFTGFGQALPGVFGHRFDAGGLARVDLQEAAFDASVLVNARCGVGAVAGAQCDPAEEEVLFEFAPFLGRGAAEFMVGAGFGGGVR